jgi:hypothetical protein
MKTSVTVLCVAVHIFDGSTNVSHMLVKVKVKGKVVPVLPLTEHHAMKVCWGNGGTAPPIL